jgi:hypothetical protein
MHPQPHDPALGRHRRPQPHLPHHRRKPGQLSRQELTAANTVSIQGTISFRTGLGMQGVNVVARPLDANGNPLYQYTVTFVSGGYFNGNHGNPVTGWTDSNGNLLTMWGSNEASHAGLLRPERNAAAARRDHSQLSGHI